MLKRIYIAATGGGAGAQNLIWRQPGCSEYFAGATFPYGREQLIDFLGFEPERYCSIETAIHMAIMAYYHAWQPGTEAVGAGLSAAVASKEPRRGRSRYHVAIMTDDAFTVHSWFFEDGHGVELREEQGAFLDHYLRRSVTHGGCGAHDVAQATELFLSRPYWSATGERLTAPPPKQTLYPGAFNPPHEGHLALADQQRAAFWIEASAPHKPSLTLAEMVQRAKLLRGRDRFFTMGCPLYLDKSNALPRRAFVIGADAFLRMLDPKWGIDPLELLRKLAENETTLLVAGRVVGGRFVSGDEAIAHVPESTNYLLQPLEGRWDVSSSERRGL